MSIASCGSRFPVGSSARISAGSPTIARATATRCCSPPLDTLGPVAAAAREPDALERLADPSAHEARRKPEHLERDRDVVEHGPAGDELEVLEDERRYCAAGPGPTRPVSRAMSRPRKRMRPSSTRSVRCTSRRSVLFPEPDGPVMKTNSPRSIVSDIPRSTGWSARYDLKTSSKIGIGRRAAEGS